VGVEGDYSRRSLGAQVENVRGPPCISLGGPLDYQPAASGDSGPLAYFTANALSVDVTVAGRNPNAPPAFTVPVAAPFSNLPVDGVSVTLHGAVPTQLMDLEGYS
jgi:hypothetical protein